MIQNEDFFSEACLLLKEIHTFESIKHYCTESSVWCNEQIKLRRDLLQQLVNEVKDSEY
ncbi:hypothetical protein 1992IndM4_0875 [Vibrio phage ICP1]|nr:hypothetical protein 1992IndM4_0875 [Vibrio phage ICP1]